MSVSISQQNLQAEEEKPSKEEEQDQNKDTDSKTLVKYRYLGLVYTLLSTNSFSLNSSILKKYRHIHPFNLGVWAFPVSGLLATPFIFYTIFVQKQSVVDAFWPLHKHKKVAFLMWIRAIISSCIVYCIIYTIRYISVADMRTLLAASVITVYFFGWLCLGETCGVVPVVVAAVAMCGIGVMTRPPILTGAEDFDEKTLIGVGLGLLCLSLVTALILTIRYLQSVHHGVLNTFLYSWGFIQSLVLSLSFGEFKVPESTSDILGLLTMGTLMSLGNTFLVLALQVEEAGVVALIRTSEVVFTFFWQWVISGESPDWISILGATLVLTGVIVVTLRKYVASLPEYSILHKRLSFLLY